MKYSKFTTTISGEDVNVVLASTEHNTVETKPVIKTHYILMIDRSGSMSYELNNLIDQTIETIDHISQNDILSIMWYSSPGQFETVVSGARANSDLKEKLNKLRRTVGSTCFSDPLANANNLVLEYAVQVNQTALILFTDGQPVVSWSIVEEEKRCKSAVQQMRSSGLSAMTCIGYGNYYNRKFLIELADETDHGQIMHNSRIDEFLETFKQSVGAAGELVKTPIRLEVTESEILYLTSKNVSHYANKGLLELDSISSERNDFFILSKKSNRYVGVDADMHDVSAVERTTDEQKQNFFYAYASKLYYYGKRLKALDIIVSNCKDKAIANRMVNAFTNTEVADVQKMLDEAVFDDNKRLIEGKCSPGFLPAKDATCVMDVFSKLFDASGSVYYVPFSKNVEKYKRIGKKVEDKESIFTPNADEVRMPLSEFVWNKDKLNLSILISVPGSVKLNANTVKNANKTIDAKTGVKLTNVFPAKIYNTHTFIKDGTLNIGKAEFLIDDDTLLKLSAIGVRSTILPETQSNLVRTIIDFSTLPVINQTYIDNSQNMDVLFDLVKENTELQCKQRVVKNELEKVYAASANMLKEGIFAKYTEEQIKVLTDHTITEKGVYAGLERVVNTDNPDSYETRILDFSINGQKTIPSVKDFELMLAGSKKINALGTIMVDYYHELDSALILFNKDVTLRDALDAELSRIKSKLDANRQKISLVKMSKVLNNDGFEDLKRDDKGNFIFEKNNETMTVKSERKMENI